MISLPSIMDKDGKEEYLQLLQSVLQKRDEKADQSRALAPSIPRADCDPLTVSKSQGNMTKLMPGINEIRKRAEAAPMSSVDLQTDYARVPKLQAQAIKTTKAKRNLCLQGLKRTLIAHRQKHVR